MLYIHWNVNPVIVRLGFFSLRYYSVLFAGGILFSYIFLQKIFRNSGVSEEVFGKLALYIIIGTVAGARLGHCLFYEPGYFVAHPLEIMLPWQGMPWTKNFRFTGYQGLASHGGALGIFIAAFLFARKHHFKLLWILDRLCLAVPAAGAMVRLGNLMNSEIIGSRAKVPWAFIFEQVDRIPRHPSQLYEALLYLSLFFVLYRLYKQSKSQGIDGILFGWFLTGLFLIRFFVEFFKANQEPFESKLPLDMGQLLSIPFIIAGIILLYRKLKLKSRKRTGHDTTPF
jgi:prolipoprotein diacylglyceryl transferase